jgi:hypothetical protein
VLIMMETLWKYNVMYVNVIKIVIIVSEKKKEALLLYCPSNVCVYARAHVRACLLFCSYRVHKF